MSFILLYKKQKKRYIRDSTGFFYKTGTKSIHNYFKMIIKERIFPIYNIANNILYLYIWFISWNQYELAYNKIFNNSSKVRSVECSQWIFKKKFEFGTARFGNRTVRYEIYKSLRESLYMHSKIKFIFLTIDY
jgi:hypothetical protein